MKTNLLNLFEDTILPIAYVVSVLGCALSAGAYLVGYIAGMAHTF